MKIIVQRSNESNVIIDNEVYNEINSGLVLLVGFTKGDNLETIKFLVNKVINLRIFDDEHGVMNRSIKDVGGEILSISQFTLYANTKKGNRPSYIEALGGEEAKLLYDMFNSELNKHIKTKTGIFGSDMIVNITNNGPVTIILEK